MRKLLPALLLGALLFASNAGAQIAPGVRTDYDRRHGDTDRGARRVP